MIQPTSTASQVGAGSNMLSVFDSIQIRNEEKISQSDRDYCEMHQANLYTILDQLDASYEAFRKDAEKYTDEYRCSLKQDGRIDYHDPYRYSSNHDHYKEFQFLPFKSMNAIVEMRAKAIQSFAGAIISYFNRSYSLSVSTPRIDEKTLPVNYRPVYNSYVDTVINHLGGKNFRQKAEEEIIARLLALYPKCGWKNPPVQKGKTIMFNNLVSYNRSSIEVYKQYELDYDYSRNLQALCSGIALYSDNRLNGGIHIVRDFKEKNVSLTEWYKLFTIKSVELKFFKNGRIDVRFESLAEADACFSKLKLNTL